MGFKFRQRNSCDFNYRVILITTSTSKPDVDFSKQKKVSMYGKHAYQLYEDQK